MLLDMTTPSRYCNKREKTTGFQGFRRHLESLTHAPPILQRAIGMWVLRCARGAWHLAASGYAQARGDINRSQPSIGANASFKSRSAQDPIGNEFRSRRVKNVTNVPYLH